MRARVETALAGVIDPEVGLDVLALGLVYGIEVDAGSVRVDLTMTTPACPLSETIVADAERAIRGLVPGRAVEIRLVWDPPWSPERMSERARRMLGW